MIRSAGHRTRFAYGKYAVGVLRGKWLEIERSSGAVNPSYARPTRCEDRLDGYLPRK